PFPLNLRRDRGSAGALAKSVSPSFGRVGSAAISLLPIKKEKIQHDYGNQRRGRERGSASRRLAHRRQQIVQPRWLRVHGEPSRPRRIRGTDGARHGEERTEGFKFEDEYRRDRRAIRSDSPTVT